jgi:hypothetical protein
MRFLSCRNATGAVFYTAVAFGADANDRPHTAAEAHRRIDRILMTRALGVTFGD